MEKENQKERALDLSNIVNGDSFEEIVFKMFE
jgi:hypothetical protein